MFNDLSSPLSYFASRRSGRPRDLVDPGPSPPQLEAILELALRTPDHGNLQPWRFVHVGRNRREALAALLHRAWRTEHPGEDPNRLEAEAIDRLAQQAPELVVALFCPRESEKIPSWEQQLSCGAAVMNLLHAAHAHGFAGGWITGWPAYSALVLAAFGRPPERIAGFVYLGTPGAPLEERIRPEPAAAISRW